MNPTDFAELVRARRTNMQVDRERAVPTELVEQLCELAMWAPNHKRTWPWRFCLVADNRAGLGDTIADAMEAHGDDPAKVAKARTKYLRTPATLLVGAAQGDSPLRTAENRDSAAAGIQNLLLGATAHGLATYWGSCPKGANEAVAQFAGFEPGTTIVAIIYLGWPLDEAAVPARPDVELHTR